ncbi:T9SS type A sorting domain-containing protein [Seonamhaeicola marinus]|uniref:T9SS type A sorting domain-containing protein n=1 Tax=Seonamhaeicola marinus TaxID=1912246 RepID=A0A5D0HKD0_9FLAO|nr:T9SS type A sorting domain-containing protein [Seonamhaeicola marinus]TYA71715.1 T9SS type A sorting domain-containing protein [Seonamhaeicola marinus]
MQKQLLKIALITLTFFGFSNLKAQVTFNNAGGDNLWSNTANWSGGALPTATDVVVITANITLDVAGVAAKLELGNGGDFSITGNAGTKLTLSGASPIIKNLKDAALTIDCDIEMTTGGNVNVDTSTGKANNKLIFASGKTLTLTGTTCNARNYSDNTFNFNGNVAGDGNFQIHKKSNSDFVFGATANFANHTGQIIYNDNEGTIVNVQSNIEAPNLFRASAGVLKLSQPSAVVSINGANTFEGTVNGAISAGGTTTLAINANQSNIGSVKVGLANNTLNLDIDNGVTEVTVNSISLVEATSLLNIIGFKEDVIKFTSTLTTDDLNKISHDGTGGALAQRATGELVYATTLSNSTNTLEGVSIYPNPAHSFIHLKTINGGNVEMYNMIGLRVKHVEEISKDFQLNVSNLKSGLYLLKVASENKSFTQKVVIK